jgi:predicted transcriptional regulator of viral defense system
MRSATRLAATVESRWERTVVDSLLFLEYSGGVDELDKALATFSFAFYAALAYLKLLKRPWLSSRKSECAS